MLHARIVRPCALLCAALAAKSFDGVNRDMRNPIVDQEVDATDITNDEENLKFDQVKGRSEFRKKSRTMRTKLIRTRSIR